MAYNGLSKGEMILSKIASFAAVGVAMFLRKCNTHSAIIPGVQGFSAGLMCLVLAYFFLKFFQQAKEKCYAQARVRAVIYALCGIAI